MQNQLSHIWFTAFTFAGDTWRPGHRPGVQTTSSGPGKSFLMHERYHITHNYPHAFFKKAMGILLTPPSVRPYICPSVPLYITLNLLNHWVEFNQTYYITFPHGNGVWEQHCFSVCLCICRQSICLSHYLLLNHWVEFNQTCYITFPHGKGVREQHYFSMHSLSVHLSVTLSLPKPLWGIQPKLLHHFPSW